MWSYGAETRSKVTAFSNYGVQLSVGAPSKGAPRSTGRLRAACS